MESDHQDTERPARRRAASVRNRLVTTAATYGVLSLAGAVSFVLPDAVPMASVAEIPKPVYGPPPGVGAPDAIAETIAGRPVDEAEPLDAGPESRLHPGAPGATASLCNVR